MDSNGEILSRVFAFALFTPVTCFLLHWISSGGLVGSHLVVVNVLSLLQCCASLILFLLIPTGDAPRKILMLLGMMLASTTVLHMTAILFGAAVISQFWESLSWSLLTSSLSILPATLLLRDDLGAWARVFLQNRFANSSEWSAWLICVATLVGAWLGALPIPLDWNRPWQVWPVPCSIGALVGNEAGLLSSIVVHHLYFQRTRTRRCV